jgi:hypothetical protein
VEIKIQLFPLLGVELWLMGWQKELGLNATVPYWFEDKQVSLAVAVT